MDYIKINKYSSIPLYVQLRDSIKGAILSGILQSGDKLPTEQEICDKFSLSRTVTRQALGELAADGYLSRNKSKGTYIKGKELHTGFFREILSFNEEAQRSGYIPKTKVLEKKVIASNFNVAKKLNINEGDSCLTITRLRYRNNIPVVYVVNFMPFPKYEKLLNYDLEDNSLYKVLNSDFNIHVLKVNRTFEAKVIDNKYADILQVRKNSAVQFVESLDYDQYNEIVEYSYSLYVGERNLFEVEINKY
ncbi:GntR family transcriptional regulator [Caproiciproducens sp.]|uniref:GntR family transcriptional regulator n=1 Tax=Caproiciproducens sp. TaxID=1954376 RepID=UPI00289D29D5|nr:GntR family transcriptional regulator [Caproiciproducens sp.]